jgi:hypothetical protein
MQGDAGMGFSAGPSHWQPAVQRAVFRPGFGQYIYIGGAPALAVLAGLGITVAALEPQAQDRIALIGIGTALVVCGGFLLAYLFGMSIEVDEERVSKVYMFGLMRFAIALRYFSASSATEYSSGSWLEWAYTRLDFESSDGVGDDFSAYPFWVWRRRDMDQLMVLAMSMTEWRATDPPPERPESPPTLGALLKMAALLTWVGGVLATIPLAILYAKWGGLATLTVACVIEFALIALAARLTWEPWSASKKASARPSGRVHLPRLRSRQTGSTEERDAGVPASDVTSPVAVTEFAPMAPNAYIQPANQAQTAFKAARPSVAREEREAPETGWAIVLSMSAFLMLVIGVWSATQSHTWTVLWPLNLLGGLMSYIPVVVWVLYGNRLLGRPIFMWSARVVALILTVAIPFIIWGPVPAPPT